MLFNSISFIFWFLPIVLFGFFSIGKFNHKAAGAWLVAAAFFFYGYWNTKYIGLLCGSILINYIFGYSISKLNEKRKLKFTKLTLVTAIAFNLGLLAYYKYSNFFLSQIDTITGTKYYIKNLILPLGISFFTFTQIAFLVDAYKQKAKEYDLLRYFLFVTYFPHLIAGPIIHHAEMMPQFLDKTTYKFSRDNFIVGTLIFAVGLAKKVLLADNIAPYADAIFKADHSLTFWDGWSGALAYTFQLYFDFSGYCDMAIGLSKMFNILLPINFNSPYKSQNIIDFWRRWHITLSRFLRDYLYIPLGGNRKGSFSRYRNLLATMVIGGLWHGASWTFVLWGTLHGSYLVINHQWRDFIKRIGYSNITNRYYYKFSAWVITFLVVVIAWVFFRAENFQTARLVLSGMFGLNGFALPTEISNHTKILFASVLLICFIFPNTQQIFSRYKPGLITYKDDIKEGHALSYFSWPYFIEMRLFGYLWFSYAISIFFMVLFYSANIDAKIFQSHFKKNRPILVDMTIGDYRSNLFSNDIFYGKEKKVVFVGSSYVQLMGRYLFEVGGLKYKSGSVANPGNSISNGFRTASTIMDNYKVDTIIFGVSALGFGEIKKEDGFLTLPDQCNESLNKIGFEMKVESFKQCHPMHLTFNQIAQLALKPGDATYFQFHDFLNKILKIEFSSEPLAETQNQYSFKDIKTLDEWMEDIKIKNKISPQVPVVGGDDSIYHWWDRKILESLNENGDIYNSFKLLKKESDAKGVRLVIYNSPTVSSKDAPKIYPKGFIEAYRKKMHFAMKKLGIEYYDYGDDFIWDNRYTGDFIHMSVDARKRIHAKLIASIFYKENTA